jgi:hypothetical protein
MSAEAPAGTVNRVNIIFLGVNPKNYATYCGVNTVRPQLL